MKTKKLNKKMTLRKSTVSNLNNIAMVNVIGGEATDLCTQKERLCNPGGTSICIMDTGACGDDDRTGGGCFTRYSACGVNCG